MFLAILCLIGFLLGTSGVLYEDGEVFGSSVYEEDGALLFDSDSLVFYDMPQSCRGKSFCFEKGDRYPQDKIEELLNQMPSVLNSGTMTRFSISETDHVTMADCPADTTYNQPIYYIRDENDDVRVVVQSPTKFQQLFTAKQCQYPGPITRDTPHFLKGAAILEMFRVECVDTHIDADFFVLAEEAYGLRLERARPKGGIPVYCKCRYSMVDNNDKS